MNWKKFFKPDRRKIIITIIIFLLFIAYWLFGWFSGINECGLSSDLLCESWILASISIIPYIFSCFIVLIYEKLKNKLIHYIPSSVVNNGIQRFLRMNKTKFIVFLIIFILALTPVRAYLFYPFSEIMGLYFSGTTNFFFWLFGWALYLFYWYLLSCLIVWIYGKFRKKQK